MTQPLRIDDIKALPEIQSRAGGIIKAAVARYADALKKGAVFPAVDVFHTPEGAHLLADGFHRLEAYKAAGRAFIEAVIHEGTKRDAILFAVGANASHGVRRTNADKSRAVDMLLADPEWVTRADTWIAEIAGVSANLIRHRRVALSKKVDARVGPTGRTRMASKGQGGSKTRPETIAAFVSLVGDGNATLIEAANRLNKTPAEIERIAAAAAREGHTTFFASNKDEREQHNLRRQVRELESAKRSLLESLRQKDVHLEALTSLNQPPIEPIVARAGIGEGKRRQGVPVLILSDLHVEERVVLEKTMGLNEYNLDIAGRCLDRCAEAFEWFEKEKKSHWDMRTAVVAIIGDTISGWIHAELVESNFLSPIKAAVWTGDMLERVLQTILANTDFERIIVVLKDGNHGRLTQKIRCSTRTENSLEWFMFHHLAQRFRTEPRIQFQIDDAIYSYLDIYNKTLALTHGDQWQYMGGIGGLLIPVRRGVNEARKFRHFDTIAMGHFHEYMPLDDIHVNGSLIGVTPYSIAKSIRPRRRCQSMFLLDSVNWKTMDSPVWLVREPEDAWRAGIPFSTTFTEPAEGT